MTRTAPTILAIETSTSACSAALLVGGQRTLRADTGVNIHSRDLLSMIEDLFQEAAIQARHLDAVAVSKGPGSFTGLRIGIGVAQGIAFAANCPMLGVSSLHALAQQVAGSKAESILAGIDARMGEIYWCEFTPDQQAVYRPGTRQVSAPERVMAQHAGPLLVGNAWTEYWDRLPDELRERSRLQQQAEYPSAAAILDLGLVEFQQGGGVDAVDFTPEYIRDDVAKKSQPKS